MPTKRDFLSVTGLSPDETLALLQRARDTKLAEPENLGKPLSGKSVAILFDKPSLRTRVSFQVGIQELGGYSVFLGQQEVGLGNREPVSDVAKVLSGYVDCIVARISDHGLIAGLAEHASVPVVNALSDVEHPCQIMADLLTIYEHKSKLEGLTLAYVGDGNNVARSLCLALPAMGMNFNIASPQGYNLDEDSVATARSRANGGGQVRTMTEPEDAVAGADVVYTDVWASMGQEAETQVRQSAFDGYTVDPELMTKANAGALFMHDMPAHYGEEVTPGMLEHPQSVAFPQAHNRLHAQKAILEFFLAGK
ncbi:MAG: ornithine carbamoyltransferase [Chloroflexi bacterium]|nr:ornithine carbamoyltransferase [Chloroflexota bacterium]MDA1272201.1 ornithine carbamoyltransferase [Chloroflexota bacterium]PKB58558.1 MAG: ornithine carbamoyltransferase [SAR202 cluster bacterium Casp-Chloro-G2]